MIRRILATLGLVCAINGVASAADLPRRTAPPPPAAPALPPAFDQTGFSFGFVGGTLGLGGELGYRVNDIFGLRGQLTGFPLSVTYSTATANYGAKVGYLSAAALADYYPFGNWFRMTAGIRVGHNSGDFTATAAGPINVTTTVIVQGVPVTIPLTLTPQQVGPLAGTVRYNQVAPYLGIGAEGAPIGGWNNFVVGFDAGLMYMGNPRAAVTSNNALVPASFLATESAALQSNARYLRFYPVVSASLKYKF